MSVENLKEYALRCARDPEMLKAAKEIGMQDLEEHMNRSKSIGLEWDQADWASFRDEVIDLKSKSGLDGVEDLSEEDLEMVAGGLFSVTIVSSLIVGASVGAAVGGVAAGAAIAGTAATSGSAW